MKIILSIVGEHLDPEQVSSALGGQPRASGRKGETIQATASGRRVSRTALAGFWQRGVAVQPQTDPTSALQAMLSDLSDNQEVWDTLGRQFTTEIAISGAPRGVAPEHVFSKESLELLQRRGVRLWMNGPRSAASPAMLRA